MVINICKRTLQIPFIYEMYLFFESNCFQTTALAQIIKYVKFKVLNHQINLSILPAFSPKVEQVQCSSDYPFASDDKSMET